MSQSHDELLLGLSYARDTMARMQGISREYAQLKKGLHREKDAVNGKLLLRHKRVLVHGVLLLAAFAGAVAIRDEFGFTVFAILAALSLWSWNLQGFMKKLYYLAAAFGAAMYVYTGWHADMQAMLAVIAAGLILCFAVVKVWNLMVAAGNRRNAGKDQAAKERMQELDAAYGQLEAELKEKTSSWYPLDYYNMQAAEFFLNAVRNHRAESVKELVDLFDAESARRRQLELQKRQAEEQRRRQQIQAQNQQAIREKLEFADRMDALARYIEGAQRDRDVRDIKRQLQDIENNLNSR